MGFFSRLFRLREQDPASPDTTWAFEDNASELLLSADEAATLVSEFDIDAAITSHEELKHRLQRMLDGMQGEALDADLVGQHERCLLGQWLKGAGRASLGQYPAFDMLVARHKYFHALAAQVVTLSQSGEHEKARQLFQGGYRHAANQVALLLKELRRGLEH